MSKHSIVEAKDQLSNLIDRAMRGEEVVITRHGHPVVELKAVAAQGRAMTAADVDRLQARRVKLKAPDDDPRSIVERMRDEDSERLLRR
jgi:prevent-host-death family protein